MTELTSRKHARLNDDPDLKQLSWENRLRRNLKIRHFNSQLELIRETSMSIVNSTSYPVFIAQLQLKLDARSDLSLNAAEIDSLKITMFQTACLAMKWQETQLHQLCSEIRTKQHQQQQRLQTAQESRARYNQSNSELSAKNSKLDLQRILLRQQAVSYSANASQQVIACGVTGSIAFAIGLFVLIMTLNPLFFIIPGVFALAALGTLIAGCVFRFKEEASLEQAKINDRQFRTNNQQINKHTSEIKKIDTEIIPVLQQNMSQSTKDLEQASKNRAKHQKKMHAQRNKANIVKDGQASQGGIFSERVTPVLVGSDAVTIDNSNSKRDLPQLASVLAKP